MFQAWSELFAKPKVHRSFVVLGVLATILLGPMSLFGAYMMVTSLFSDAPDRNMFLGWSLVGSGGIIAISSAWVRLLVPRRYFQENTTLKWSTAFGLTVGLSISVLLLFNPAMAWIVAPAIPIGIFLLGTTIGERLAEENAP